MAGDKNYLDLLEKMKELHIKKNAGYSGDSQDRWANFRMSESFGVSAVLGCLVRMSDKFIRIKNLIKNPNNEQVGEAITDTLMDLASYALITICLINEKPSTSPKYQPVLVLLDESVYNIEIVNCSSEKFWYNKSVGKSFISHWDGTENKFFVKGVGKAKMGGWVILEDCRVT